VTYDNFIQSPSRELGHRQNDGIDVMLFWRPADDELTVCVFDQRCGAYFEIHPTPHLALDVFYHPYSYVPSNVVHYEDEPLAA
jgi:hypothetical protein